MLMPPTAAQAGQAVTDSAGIERRYCAFDGDGFLGSRGGAKASVDFVYLAPVLGKGVTVRALCEVSGIRRASTAAGPGYVVEFNDLERGTSEAVTAPRVVMAAGTLNTLRLLFASSIATAGLAAMPALGRGYFGNGDLIAAWVKPSVSVPSFRAAPVLGAISVPGHEHKPVELGSLSGFDTLPLPGFVKRYLSRVFMIYVMAADSGKATVRFVDGRLRTDYDYRKEPVYDELHDALRILQQDRGSRMHSLKKPVTPHMGGGARIGASALEGVVDHRGEVHGNPGLFVADGAALPAPPGGPPALAIAAWAHHVADGIAARC
jgi:cholesterol oxidase